MSRLRIIILILTLLVLITNSFLSAPYSAANSINPTKRLGGPSIVLESRQIVDYKTHVSNMIASLDKDNNNIADDLEAKVAGMDPNQIVKAILIYNAYPTTQGINPNILLYNLNNIIDLLKKEGVIITAGPWKNAIVGFAFNVPASKLYNISNFIPRIDIDGDGTIDNFIIVEDKQVKALNHWSSKQMNTRPYVWNNLKVKGKGVSVVVIDTGIDGSNSAFPPGKIVYWADYVGDANGNKHATPYDDNMHGTHVSGTVAGSYDAFDQQGRFVINFGISDLDFSSLSPNTWYRFRAPYAAYYVNSTGTVELDFKWNPDTTNAYTQGAVGAVGIGFCGNATYSDCSPTVVVNISTPNPNEWYNLTYDVTSSNQYGFYTFMFQLSNPGGVAMLPIMRFPVNPDDATGVPYLSGMAPEASLGGAKVLTYYGSGDNNDIVSAIDDVVGNRTSVSPSLYVISMSLGGSYSSVLDGAVTSAVNNGIVVVVAAGNDGPNGDAATGSPANNPYAITVAAIDALGNITDYSSSGGASNSSSVNPGDTVYKPDLAAPGGGDYLMIFSADTTWHDDLLNYDCFIFFCSEDIDWNDALNGNTEGYDDSIGISGTSMATPHVSGVAALVISALINNASLTWQWNAADALLVKNILLMSTFETYPLVREDNATYSPTLDKGGKDVHEGYGALDASAAVDIALSMGAGNALLPGSIITTRFRNGTVYMADFPNGNWDWPFGRSVWGSRVYLPNDTFKDVNGNIYDTIYVFHLRGDTSDIPNTDFDLYLYSVDGNTYGEPVIVASSTNGMGVRDEVIQYNPSSPESVVLVAKRAREDSAGGNVYAIIGPYANATSNVNGNIDDHYAYTGYNVEVTGISAYQAPQAIVNIIDNTTGQVLDTLTISTVSRTQGYSELQASWTVPNDPLLDGHVLLFVVQFVDDTGNVVEGPTYDVLIVSSTPPPVPEPPIVPLLIIVLVLVIWRLSKIHLIP